MKWSMILSASLTACLAAGCGSDEKEKKSAPKPAGAKPSGVTSADKPSAAPKEPAPAKPAASSGYEVVAVTDKGSIKGSVKWSGEAPSLAPLPVKKDTETCGKEKQSPRLLIDKETKGVANTVVYLENISKGADLSPRDGALDQKACDYTPHVQIVPVGSKLKIINSDPILHNVHAYLGTDSVFNLAMPMEGQSLNKDLKKPGLMSMKCDAGHTWMSSYVFVAEHPYYAMTDAQGNFVLENVPPGKYTVKMWHEGWEANISDTAITYGEPVVDTKEVEVTKDGVAEVSFELPGN